MKTYVLNGVIVDKKQVEDFVERNGAKCFEFEIVETLKREVVVCNSDTNPIKIVKDLYEDCTIVLHSDDFSNVSFIQNIVLNGDIICSKE